MAPSKSNPPDPAALGLAVTPAQREQWQQLASKEGGFSTAKQVMDLCQDHATLLARVAALTAENDALKAQFKSAGIVPYLDRMKELTDRLEAQAAIQTALVAALKAVEYRAFSDGEIVDDYGQKCCPMCKGKEPSDTREPNISEGHRQDCTLALALARVAAGGGAQ